MKSYKVIIKYTITALLVVVFISCKNNQSSQKKGATPVTFNVKKVKKQDAVIYKEYAANFEGQQNVEIRPKISGLIQKIYVDEGQVVKKGELLFKLETQTLNQDALAAKAKINVAQVEVDRLIPLVKRNIISIVQLETAKANLAQAKSNYNSILANINYANITSPVNGVIGSIPYREGSLVSATSADPLTTVSDIKNIRAYFSLNEKEVLDFSKSIKGKTMDEKIKNLPEVSLVLVDNSIYPYKGKIETINGLVNKRTGSTQFRAAFPNPERILRSGGSGTVKFPFIESNVILAPQVAIFEMQGKKIVYVLGKENKVDARVVEINGTQGLNYIVTNNLKEGETIVVDNVLKLTEGQEITPNYIDNNSKN